MKHSRLKSLLTDLRKVSGRNNKFGFKWLKDVYKQHKKGIHTSLKVAGVAAVAGGAAYTLHKRNKTNKKKLEEAEQKAQKLEEKAEQAEQKTQKLEQKIQEDNNKFTKEIEQRINKNKEFIKNRHWDENNIIKIVKDGKDSIDEYIKTLTGNINLFNELYEQYKYVNNHNKDLLKDLHGIIKNEEKLIEILETKKKLNTEDRLHDIKSKIYLKNLADNAINGYNSAKNEHDINNTSYHYYDMHDHIFIELSPFKNDVEKAKKGDYTIPEIKRKRNDKCLISDEK
jgi:DNA repair exonuclease SbcCD ATPase subunit